MIFTFFFWVVSEIVATWHTCWIENRMYRNWNRNRYIELDTKYIWIYLYIIRFTCLYECLKNEKVLHIFRTDISLYIVSNTRVYLRKCISRIFYSFTYYLDSIIDDILLEHAGFFLVYHHAIIVSLTQFPFPFDDNKQRVDRLYIVNYDIIIIIKINIMFKVNGYFVVCMGFFLLVDKNVLLLQR